MYEIYLSEVEGLKIPISFARIYKLSLLQRYKPSKLGALEDEIIPLSKWKKYSSADILRSTNAISLKFGVM